jgi:spermidine/putrescine transport system substrate-binding protein
MEENMKKSVSFAMLLSLVLLSILTLSCGGESGKRLYIYNWTYYTPDSVIEKFETEFGVEVVYDSFASNEEMFTKLMAGGSGYDIIFPSGDYVSIMISLGMLDPIDKTKIPNIQHIDPLVLEKATYDPNMEYSIPYYFGAAGIAVNTAKVPQFEESWSIFARQDLKGRMTMLDDMREVMGDALTFLGYSVNSTNPNEVEEAKNLIINQWKPNLVKFDAEAFGKGFANGEFWVVQGYVEGVYQELAEDQKKDVKFFIPSAGGPSYLDSMCLLKGSKNKDLAMEFINFIHRPEIYAEFTDDFGFPATVNVPARELKKTAPLYEAEDLVNTVLKDDLGRDKEMYDDAWEEIKIGL